MNTMKVARSMLLAFSLALQANGTAAAPPAYRLHVDGLACPFCAYGLEKKLGAIDGVANLETNIKDGTMTVTMREGMALDEGSARKAVEEAGFSLRSFDAVQLAPQAGGRQ